MVVRLGVLRADRRAVQSSSKCGRKIAWVAIGRIVDMQSMLQVVEAGRLRTRTFVEFVVPRLGHQSVYLATGGAGAGPSTVNHLRYNVFQVPSRRIRSSVPFTKRTSPVFCRLTPIP